MGSGNGAVAPSVGTIQENGGVQDPPLLLGTGTAEPLQLFAVRG